MDIHLQFLGAARSVTGSRYLLEANGKRILIDCGLFQERDFQDRNYDPFPVPANSIDTVLLTHAHLDHCGLLPKLVAEGFGGDILGTRASLSIADIIMQDSARIQQEDLRYKLKRLKREGRKPKHPAKALYTVEDAQQTSRQLTPIEMEKDIEIAQGVTARWREAGHILGACSILITVKQNGDVRKILFSGDIGRTNQPILRDPKGFDGADYVITESTYGNRLHEPAADIPGKLERIVNRTVRYGGNIVIPSFAVERTQDLMYHLSHLLKEKRIPPMMVFVDSPMAIKVTEVFKRNAELFDKETRARLEEGDHPVDFKGLVMTRSPDQSKAINNVRGSCIIIAGSGMCTGGRIKHHLKHNISREENTILFVGYQAKGTLGRYILERPDDVRIHGDIQPVRAMITKINGFSGHADRDELFAWLRAMKKPKHIFITHGEKDVAESYGELIEDKLGVNTTVPDYQQRVSLS